MDIIDMLFGVSQHKKTFDPFQEVSFNECLQPRLNKCENYIEEDCQYLGTILLEPPPGTVSDGLECQEMCNEYKDLGCKYWVYHRTEKSCTLYESNARKCSAKGGPYLPSISLCL